MGQPGIIFDLDGTLVDSVYRHVAAWRGALLEHGIVAAHWKIYRAIGMSGRLFLREMLRNEGHSTSKPLVGRLERAHDDRFNEMIRQVAPLTGTAQLLKRLKRRTITFAIATSGDAKQTKRLLGRIVGLPLCPVITADDIASAKPAPDLFELAASKLDKEPMECFVVGDSIWDVLAVALAPAALTAAYRVYADPLELSESLEQLGFPAAAAK